ncbi:hypothetical protein FNF29_04610 [Cafeteria roenbergensis]|uniref:G-protein coupled receptors family 2 profile 2 domain-containing protein n=1 Tax=Cafeteria roenbergensis TaxID=33653 RepID=A0A5A8CHT9_CAFRO|nr:hypothetical protein FNF29_04610 [Cafeteria roenbergensis]|eukprot:KAA0151411.1 hypothetical protein FNF29_04610 [Cafeteria roenbergensis]
MSGPREAEAATLSALTLVAASLSFVGSVAIVITYLSLRRVQRLSYRVIAWLAAADCMASMAYFVHEPSPLVTLAPPYSASCIAGAALSQFMDVATFLWTVCVSITVYMVLVRQASAPQLQAMERWFHVVCWGVPAVFLAATWESGAFGDAGLWCWITDAFPGLRLGLYYAPLLVCIVAVAVMMVLIRRGVQGSSAVTPAQKPLVMRRILVFFALFLGLRLPSLANRIQQLSAGPGAEPVFVLSLLHATFSPLQGFANALVYGFNRLVVTEYRVVIARCRGTAAENSHGEAHARTGSGVHARLSIELNKRHRNALEADTDAGDGAGSRPGHRANPAHRSSAPPSTTARSPAGATSPIAESVFGVVPAPPKPTRSFVNPLSIRSLATVFGRGKVQTDRTGTAPGTPAAAEPRSAAHAHARTHGGFHRARTWHEGCSEEEEEEEEEEEGDGDGDSIESRPTPGASRAALGPPGGGVIAVSCGDDLGLDSSNDPAGVAATGDASPVV